jgi:signal transduction histidine kinase
MPEIVNAAGATDRLPAREAASPRRLPARYSLLGMFLGLGAPLGFLALRRLVLGRRGTWTEELRTESAAYWYMALATPAVIGVFGRLLGEQQDRLRLSYEHLERLREEFAAVVAHDLRNPIQAMLMQLDALLRRPRDGGVSVPLDALHRLHRGGERLAQMVNDLLDATRIEASRLRVSPQPVSLPNAVSALIETVGPTLGPHSLGVSSTARVPPVLADPARLDQILTNLLENAAKYSAEGKPIRVAIRAEGGGAAVCVEDEGWGIPADELPRLFDRFYQAKRAREKKSGLGLGLYITKGLVEAQGGRIGVRSEVGRGSAFTVWLPAAGRG